MNIAKFLRTPTLKEHLQMAAFAAVRGCFLSNIYIYIYIEREREREKERERWIHR